MDVGHNPLDPAATHFLRDHSPLHLNQINEENEKYEWENPDIIPLFHRNRLVQ